MNTDSKDAVNKNIATEKYDYRGSDAVEIIEDNLTLSDADVVAVCVLEIDGIFSND